MCVRARTLTSAAVLLPHQKAVDMFDCNLITVSSAVNTPAFVAERPGAGEKRGTNSRRGYASGGARWASRLASRGAGLSRPGDACQALLTVGCASNPSQVGTLGRAQARAAGQQRGHDEHAQRRTARRGVWEPAVHACHKECSRDAQALQLRVCLYTNLLCALVRF